MDLKHPNAWASWSVIVGLVAGALIWLGGNEANVGLSDARPQSFEGLLREWSENARTNAPIETTAQFVARDVRPIVDAECPNPFRPGGAEVNKPWSREGRLLYGRLIQILCGESPSCWWYGEDTVKQAKALVSRGCRDPLVQIFAALDPWKEANRKLEVLEASFPEEGFLRVVSAYFRARFAGGLSAHDVRARFVDWMRQRAFTSEREQALSHLAENLVLRDVSELFGEFKGFDWAMHLAEAEETMNEGRQSAGGGVPKSISTKGWNDLSNKSAWAWKSLDEADDIHSNRVETVRRRLWVMGESRQGRKADLDALFRQMTALRLDDPDGLGTYVWHRLYPRWGCCCGYGDMLKFADACRRTERHDTMLPYLHAELQCRYVRDAELDPRAYFASHPDIVDSCLEACSRQMTNDTASAHVRWLAPYVGSFVAFQAGRYAETNLFSAMDWLVRNYWDVARIFPDPDVVYSYRALAGQHGDLCVRMQRAFDEGRYEDVLKEAETAKSWLYQGGQPLDATTFVGKLLVNARVKLGLGRGEKVFAEALPCYPGWRNYSWWRSGNCVWDSMPNTFAWKGGLRWRAELPLEHELEFELEPKPKTDGRHVVVVSRFQHERSHHLPLNGIPYVTLVWEKERTGLVVKDDYYRMFKIDSSELTWIPASGPSLRRKIRIVCNGNRLSVFVDGETSPVWSSDAFFKALRKAKPVGFAEFRGDNVRISKVFVSPVQSNL